LISFNQNPIQTQSNPAESVNFPDSYVAKTACNVLAVFHNCSISNIIIDYLQIGNLSDTHLKSAEKSRQKSDSGEIKKEVSLNKKHLPRKMRERRRNLRGATNPHEKLPGRIRQPLTMLKCLYQNLPGVVNSLPRAKVRLVLKSDSPDSSRILREESGLT
jgi:hypothetical protein